MKKLSVLSQERPMKSEDTTRQQLYGNPWVSYSHATVRLPLPLPCFLGCSAGAVSVQPFR